jgi:hypothetical protein
LFDRQTLTCSFQVALTGDKMATQNKQCPEVNVTSVVEVKTDGKGCDAKKGQKDVTATTDSHNVHKEAVKNIKGDVKFEGNITQ